MAKFFDERVRLKKRRRSAEKYHWCAMAYRGTVAYQSMGSIGGIG
jgi:hypothetical protein